MDVNGGSSTAKAAKSDSGRVLPEGEQMTCAEFQQALPYIFDSGGEAKHEEHLKTCPVCSDLVADLRYIAEQAKLLVPMEEPDARVWHGIERSLEREGLVKPAQARRSLLGRQSFWIIPIIGLIGVLAYFLSHRS